MEELLKHTTDVRAYQIAILDDDALVRDSLSLCLNELGYQTVTFAAGEMLLKCLDEISCDLLICDLCMPNMDGLEFLERAQLKKRHIPAILLTAFGSFDAACKAVNLGVRACFSKPYQLKELRKSIRYLIAERVVSQRKDEISLQIQQQIEHFKGEVQCSNERYRSLVYASLESLMNSLEIKDEYTREHSKRVSEYIGIFASALGLETEEISDLKLAGIFHDIGKIGINEDILKKQSGLTDDEYEVIKTHPLISEYILQPLHVFSPVLEIVRSHHERIDGLGYPMGIVGDDIPFGGKIMAIIDAYDAMSSDRPYRQAYDAQHIITEFENNQGTQFDTDLTRRFIDLLKKDKFAS